MLRFGRSLNGAVSRGVLTGSRVGGSASVGNSARTPSTTTTIQLLDLPLSMTESKLGSLVGELDGCRKVEMEPGFAVHFSSEAEVEVARERIIGSVDKLGITDEACTMAHTTMPSLLLENLPGHVTSHSLTEAFKGTSAEPTHIHLMGSQSLQMKAGTAAEAMKAAKVIMGVEHGGQTLHARTARVGEKYIVHIHNVPAGTSLDDAQSAIDKALSGMDVKGIEKVEAPADRITLRYAGKTISDAQAVMETVQTELGGDASDMKSIAMKKPAVVLRCKDMSAVEKFSSLMTEQYGASRVQVQPKGKGSAKRSLVIGYFTSDQAASSALKSLRTEYKAAANFKRLSEPIVQVSGLPLDATEEDVAGLFSLFQPAGVKIASGSGTALVWLNSPGDVRLASAAMNRKPFVKLGSMKGGGAGAGAGAGAKMEVTPAWEHGCDLGLEIPASTADVEGIILKLGGLGNLDKATSPADAVVSSAFSASLAFGSEQDAIDAHDAFAKGRAALAPSSSTSEVGTNLVTSRLVAAPSYTLECVGLDTEIPAADVAAVLDEAPLGISRSAILKFRRHGQVVPALKGLKAMKTEEGDELKAVRFRATERDGDGDYDEAGPYEHFDRWSLKSVMTDYLGADPGLRMQIAKNVFERSLSDAKAFKDITWLLENSSSPSIKQEASKLLRAPPSKLNTKRLFELFLQREDMTQFVGDFREMTAFFGAANDEDPFDWSQFKIDSGEDITRLQEAMEQADRDAALYASVGPDGQLREKNLKGKVMGEDPGSVMIKPSEEDEEVEVSLEDPSQLKDRDGRVWSGCILNTDTVQKTMPGNRVLTHRALVVVGNLRGAAGFGMGKGQTPPDAINAAFRSALRNLTHIDLFDNYGLAHDVHGKHNSCHAYIKATPRSRMMVASPFASAILTRFGISSASVKIVGRRDPYAQVRAVFNAIGKHENIDEFARDRGQRYLDLRWVYDSKV